MIQFGRLLSFPLEYKHLENKVKEVHLDGLKATKLSDKKILVEANANEHNVQIIVLDDLIRVHSPVICMCSCQFFAYNLAYSLHQQKSLLNPEIFVLRPPKQKNTSLVLSGCKHIIKVARDILAKDLV